MEQKLFFAAKFSISSGLTWILSVTLFKSEKANKKRLIPMNVTIKILLGNMKRQNEYVFPSPKPGGKLTDIKRSFRKAIKEASIKDFRFHDLRHTAATRMADAGADAFTLMKILGHSDIKMTSCYTHATDVALRRAVENLDENSDFSNYW